MCAVSFSEPAGSFAGVKQCGAGDHRLAAC